MLMYSRRFACFEHPNLFKVNPTEPMFYHRVTFREQGRKRSASIPTVARRGPHAPTQSPTTSFLTATTLIYTLGAGITAAAGTRLALQLFLANGFKLYSFR